MNKYLKMNYKFLLLLFLPLFAVAIDRDTIPDVNAVTSVYKFEIREEIAPPVWRMTQKALQESLDLHADIVVIHMNTYGGMLDAADSIRTAILKHPIPVYVFIDNNAASAGALISIACDQIYMHPGANIGAATVVDQSGKPLPDKYQSYMRSMMRSTAESSGRNPDIAQAMVDPSVYVKNISDTGKVLTFTATEAMKYGFCEGIVENFEELYIAAEINNYEVVEQVETGLDKIIGLLISPYISGILIMLIIGGIYFELQSPGLGFPSAAAVLAALLYFAPLYLEGLAEHWEIILFIIGVILIAVEIFAIPGFGVAGILGVVFIFTGLIFSLVGNVGFDFSPVGVEPFMKAFFIVIAASFIAIIGSIYLTRKLLTTTALGHLALDTVQNKDSGYTTKVNKYAEVVGKTGIAYTDLRPAGKVQIGEDVFDANAETGYITKGSTVRVVNYHIGGLFVIKE